MPGVAYALGLATGLHQPVKLVVGVGVAERTAQRFLLLFFAGIGAARAQNAYTTCMWHNLLHSKIIYDRNGRYESLQNKYRRPYPAELKKNIIKKQLLLLDQASWSMATRLWACSPWA